MIKIIRKQIVIIFFSIASLVALLNWCSRNAEQAAYEEVLLTLSAQKLASFIKTYPDSKYGDLLINEFMGICDSESDSKDCYGMLLKTIPDSRQHELVVEKYKKIK